MGIKITAEEYAEKQARRLKASTEDIRRGVGRVTESPTAKAAAAQEKMLARLTESVRSGKWAAGLKRVSLEDWKSKMLEKGINRIAAGIDAAKPKVVAFATQLLAYEDSLLGRIDSMPDLTLEDSINRASEWMRGMSKFKRGG